MKWILIKGVEKMLLSICMMIKDEEKNLERCLNSLVRLRKKIASELIIIDTGSKDSSPDIARRYTDKVYFHNWNNNFSEMRNISISYAKGKWIFIIDADEELRSYDEIIKFFLSDEYKKYNAATILCKNIMGTSEYNTIALVTPRLFKNDENFKYVGAVHNAPIYTKPIKNMKDILYHYGYLTIDKELVEKKFKRTSTLLLNELEKEPNNVYYRYQLSVSYFSHGDYKEAFSECFRAYEYIKTAKLNIRSYFYIYPHLVKCLIMLKNYEEAKEICKEAIGVEKEQLDIYCYLGEVLVALKEYDEAIDAFNKYLQLVRNYDNLSIINDSMMYFEKLSFVEKAYHYLAIIYYNKKAYEKVLEYSHLIKIKEIVKDSIPLFIESFLRLDRYKELYDYYEDIVSKDTELNEFFCDFLEKVTVNTKYDDLGEIFIAFSAGDNNYSILNKFRAAILNDQPLETNKLKNYIESLELNALPDHYGDILLYFIKFKIELFSILLFAKEINIIRYLIYLSKKDKDIYEKIYTYLDLYREYDGFQYTRINKVFYKFLLASGNYGDDRYKEIFMKYIESGIRYIAFVYSKEVIEHELIAEIKNNEEGFLIYVKKAFELRDIDKIGYVRYLKKALYIYPEMKQGITLLIDEEFNEKESRDEKFDSLNEEMLKYKKIIKDNYKTMLDRNELSEAEKLLKDYMSLDPKDEEIASMEKMLEIKKLQTGEEKSVLLLCHFYSIYMKEFLIHLNQKLNLNIAVMTMDKSYNQNIPHGIINNLYVYNDIHGLINLLKTQKKYEIIHVHFLTPFYGDLAKEIRAACSKLIITIWGSDFYRTTKADKEKQRKLIEAADIITFDNEVTLNEFANYYGKDYVKKSCINRFGLTALEYIKAIENVEKDKIKEKLNIPKDAIVISCGYNANSAHNHLQIIASINEVKNKLPQNIYYIFPMTYSRDEEYCSRVKKQLIDSKLNYIILENFINFNEIADYTKVTDIMVQLQTTDTLSASMQEHMYSGNIIITGSWLPYKPFKDIGVYFLEVSSVDKIGKKLVEVIEDINIHKQRCKKNTNLIRNFSSWENTVMDWIKIYNEYENRSVEKFNHSAYWDLRYSKKFDIEASGYMGLGTIYNKYLYKSRLDVLDYIIRTAFNNLKGKKVLELGPGTGYFTDYFLKAEPQYYCGIDISKNVVALLSKKHKKAKFISGDISENISFQKGKTFDLIFASDVLLHLTEDEKFKEAIHNITLSLEAEGFYVGIEPISMTNFKTNSPHNRIIEYNELIRILESENLSLLAMIPVTFFMDYPFDSGIMKEEGKEASELFDQIYNYYLNSTDSNVEKEKVAQSIYNLDKLCLLKYGVGLSNKVILLQKKINDNVNNKWSFELSNIWKAENLELKHPNDKISTKYFEDILKKL